MNRSVIFVSIVLTVFSGTLPADDRAQNKPGNSKTEEEVAVFVTGSMIPKRVRIQKIGTPTTSPVRVIDRREIDQTGRLTTPGAFVNEPAVRLIGR